MVDTVFRYLSQPNEIAILCVLYKNGTMKLTALWEEVGSSYAAIKNICTRMEGFGLIKIEPVPPKFFEVSLTDIGLDIAKDCASIYDKYNAYLNSKKA